VITFDPTTNRIVLDSAYASASDVYSQWKRWVATNDNLKYLPAFRSVGGDPLSADTSVPVYLFLMNGWKIRPMEANHTLHITGGQISCDDGSDPVVPTLGNYNVLVDREVPVAAIGVVSGGSSSVDPNAIAAAVVAALNQQTVNANVKQVNGIAVGGAGTESNPWGPA
jgi:hypothetical protein